MHCRAIPYTFGGRSGAIASVLRGLGDPLLFLKMLKNSSRSKTVGLWPSWSIQDDNRADKKNKINLGQSGPDQSIGKNNPW